MVKGVFQSIGFCKSPAHSSRCPSQRISINKLLGIDNHTTKIISKIKIFQEFILHEKIGIHRIIGHFIQIILAVSHRVFKNGVRPSRSIWPFSISVVIDSPSFDIINSVIIIIPQIHWVKRCDISRKLERVRKTSSIAQILFAVAVI